MNKKDEEYANSSSANKKRAYKDRIRGPLIQSEQEGVAQVIDTWAIPFSSLHYDKASLLSLFAPSSDSNTYLTPLKQIWFLHLVILGSEIRGPGVDKWNSDDREEMGRSRWKYLAGDAKWTIDISWWCLKNVTL